MRASNDADRLAKRVAVLERDCIRLREGPPQDVGLSGCGDHGCLVNPARGVGTNGGCRCPEVVLRRMIQWQAREIARLRGVAERDRDEIEQYRELLKESDDKLRAAGIDPDD